MSMRRRTTLAAGAGLLLVVLVVLIRECSGKSETEQRDKTLPGHLTPPTTDTRSLDHLYWEEPPALPPTAEGLLGPLHPPERASRCPGEMVEIRAEYCIDRFEISLVDGLTDRALSPFYSPTPQRTRSAYNRYRSPAMQRAQVPLPEPPEVQLEVRAPVARSIRDQIPQGYLDFASAEAACRAAGKRLCSLPEWVGACRGQENRRFPYGDRFSEGACNVHRKSHPAVLLHGDASREHFDPRLNLLSDADGPLLRRTGETQLCRSEWGSDAAFDMVGNLDEWVADGSFVGGFYARATQGGCDARINSHAAGHFDYSIGGRCCLSLEAAPR